MDDSNSPPPSKSWPASPTTTPRRPARDLSELFTLAEGSTPSPSRGGRVAKRMLGRTRTEPSLPSTPRSHSDSVTHKKVPSSPPSSIPISQQHPTRTYAGRSRSFLIELPTSALSTGNAASIQNQHDLDTRESYSSLRAKYNIDISSDDPSYPRSPSPPSKSHPRLNKDRHKQNDLDPNMHNPLSSITDLRSKGESRRFLDEVGYLFEGMDCRGGLGLRRSSALEIVTKLASQDFARKAKAAGFFPRAWDVMREAGAGDGDKILDILLPLFTTITSQVSPTSIADLALNPSFVPTLFSLLSEFSPHNDILALTCCDAFDAEMTKSGVGRAEKKLLVPIHSLLRKSDIFHSSTPINTRLLLTHTLSILSPSLLSPSDLPSLLQNLKRDLALLSPHISTHDSVAPFGTDISFEHIENCLRMIDSYLLGHWNSSHHMEPNGEIETDEELGDGLVNLCVVAEVIIQDNRSVDRHRIAHNCMETALRVLINLSHEDKSWTRILLAQKLTLPFIMRTIIKSHFLHSEAADPNDNDEAAQSLDRLCFSLGLLTNIVQAADDAKDLTRETRIDPKCTSERTCLYNCICPNSKSALNCLSLVYLHAHSNTSDACSAFLRGHLAVLFGLLMLDSTANQKIILSSLPGSSTHTKLNALIEQAREFASFYTDLTSKLITAQENRVDEDSEQGLSPHYGVERIVGDGKGENVARDVISYLERLLDRQPIN